MKIFNFPTSIQAIDLCVSCDNIKSWSIINTNAGVASIALVTHESTSLSDLEGLVSVSHNEFEFQGADIEIEITIPTNVTDDLENGFIMTDEDDGFQRCKKISETVFEYRCELDGDTFELIIDVDSINHESAISGYYDSIDDVHSEYGDDANMIIAECYFESCC